MPAFWGIDLSITNKVVLLWGAALATFILLTLACRRKNIVPRGVFQNLFEALVEFVAAEPVTAEVALVQLLVLEVSRAPRFAVNRNLAGSAVWELPGRVIADVHLYFPGHSADAAEEFFVKLSFSPVVFRP